MYYYEIGVLLLGNIKNRRQRKRNRRGRILVTLMSAILVSIFVVRIVELQSKNAAYEKQLAYLQEEYDEQVDRKSKLEEKEKYMQTKKFVEDYAKEKLGLIYPNEVVFKAD